MDSAPRRNLYELLQVPTDASMAHIRKAYRRRALESHPDKQASSVEAGSMASYPVVPFIVVSAAATLLLDPVRRRQYDQLLFLNKLSTAGRISNSDEVEFGLEDAGGEFVILGDDEAEEDTSADDNSDFRWCGLECRCGGWYRVAIPSAFWKPSSDQQLAERTIHVECESCSLVIAVEKVPALSRRQQTDRIESVNLANYLPLFLGLEAF
eukprot:GILI01027895.1.p1 GENE.GILI01027895.1~~GILI01027895.1.p1  ORF type:complete len:210 (-),score=41.11 GILI01027895.1:59-688(-)